MFPTQLQSQAEVLLQKGDYFEGNVA